MVPCDLPRDGCRWRSTGLYCGSMRKGKTKERDRELITRLQAKAPEVLSAKVDFDALVTKVISADPSVVTIGAERRKRRITKRAAR